VWAPESYAIDGVGVGKAKGTTGGIDHVGMNNDRLIRMLALKSRFATVCFGRDADDVDQGNGTRRCCSRAKRFELVLGRFDVEAVDCTNGITSLTADQSTEDRVECVFAFQTFR